MASVNSTPHGSPTVTPICESTIHEVVVGLFFSWDDLKTSLSSYVDKIVDQWETDVPEPVKKFCAELETWLNDPESAKLDPEKSLQFWKDKVDEINSEGLPDFPEIIINKG